MGNKEEAGKYFNLEHLNRIVKRLNNNSEDGRYKAYVLCRKYFIKNCKAKVRDFDVMALHLFSYLSSFGMVYYGSFLYKCNYEIMIGAIKILCNGDYDALINNNPLTKGSNFVGLILKLKGELEKYFIKELNLSGKHNLDTLISKIMLGTFGCVPAYDANVVKKLRRCKITATFSKESLETIIAILQLDKTTLNKFYDTHKNIDKNIYTPMRLFDLCLWGD